MQAGKRDYLKVKVKLFVALREIFGNKEIEVELAADADLKVLLETLCNSARSRQVIFDESGELREYLVILKNGRHVTHFSGKPTELADGDEVTIFPIFEGG